VTNLSRPNLHPENAARRRNQQWQSCALTLQRLKADIKAGKINVVICFKLDRLTRSLRDFVELWELFEQHNVDVISLRENFDTSMPAGTAMLRLVMVFAELEREMTAERTYSIMRDRAEHGLWNGGHTLGYISDPADKGRLILDEDGAALVRRIFDLFEELGSAGAVTGKLSQLGVRYPTYQTRSGKTRGGKLFTKQKVTRILRNRIYLGEIHWGKESQNDCHAAIITAEQFERVKHRLAQTTKRRHNFKAAKTRRYLLTGMLRCKCGAYMVGTVAHGRNGAYRYYACTRQIHTAGKVSCNAPRIPADALESALLARIRDLGCMTEARERIVSEALRCIDGESQRLQDEEDVVRRQLAKTRGDISRLVEVLKHLGSAGLASVGEELARLKEEEKSLQSKIKELASHQEPLGRVNDDACRFIETWKDVGELLTQAAPDEQHLILQHYVEVIELTATDEKGKAGTYALRLFPEVQPSLLADDDDAAEKPPAGTPETPIQTTTGAGNDPSLLTESGLVRTNVQKAPRQGLEPWTSGLTVACLSGERQA
jgi:site-specific DNA recombinase